MSRRRKRRIRGQAQMNAFSREQTLRSVQLRREDELRIARDAVFKLNHHRTLLDLIERIVPRVGLVIVTGNKPAGGRGRRAEDRGDGCLIVSEDRVAQQRE
jgi:hypothetical protein